MPMRKVTILHVEDDHTTARMVEMLFWGFGFHGEMISADSVQEAQKLLAEMERDQKLLSLILTDMNPPDGTGLDIIREVRRSPAWRLTPIIVLSGEAGDQVVNSAYALGANCYMPKISGAKSPMDALRDLYRCWVETALLPGRGSVDRLRSALERSIELRARTSEFYIGLAKISQANTDEMEFWLNRALSAGNLSNLAAFFRDKISQCRIPVATLESIEALQGRITDSLDHAEESLRWTPSPGRDLTYRWVLDLLDELDESVLSEVLGCLFPVSPVATMALKARAAAQLEEMAHHILANTSDDGVRQRAGNLLELAKRLNVERISHLT